MKEQTGSKYFTLLFPPEFRRASNLRLYTFIVLFFVLFTSAAENVEAGNILHVGASDSENNKAQL